MFRQRLVHRDAEVAITLLDAAVLERPVLVGEDAVLEPGSPVVWFTYPGRWHDIGRFHAADGRFTGFYANVLTPVEMMGSRWRTTDLCLDLWMGVDGDIRVLDLDEFEAAERAGWIDAPTAQRAREEISSLERQARAGTWPPRHTSEWTLERAIRAAQELDP